MAAAPTGQPTGSSIEALFRPANRFRDLRGDIFSRILARYTEVELLPGLTVENVRATGVTWEGFCRFLQGKVVWITHDVFISPKHLYAIYIYISVLGLRADVHTKLYVHIRSGTAPAAAAATCDCMLRLLATCEDYAVYIEGHAGTLSTPLSGARLSLFLQESRDSLRKVTLQYMTLNEDHCLALVTMSRLDLEVILNYCSLIDDAAGAFVDCLQSDRGPVKLIDCPIDSQILASALTGNRQSCDPVQATSCEYE
jgi:hypothetical protein